MSETCAICYEKPPSVLLNPCLHRDFCGDCVAKLRDPKICPVCRVNIQSVIPIQRQSPPPAIRLFGSNAAASPSSSPILPQSVRQPIPTPSPAPAPVPAIAAAAATLPVPEPHRPHTPPMMSEYWRRFENDSHNADNEDAIIEFSTSRLSPQNSKLVIFKQYSGYILGDIYYIPETKEALYMIVNKNSYPYQFCICIVQIHSPSAADRIATPVNITVDLPRLFTPRRYFTTTNLNHRFIGHFRNKIVMAYLEGEYTIYQMLHYTLDDFYAARRLEFRDMNMYSYIFNNLLVIRKNSKEQRKKVYVYDILTLEQLNKLIIPANVDFDCRGDVIHYFETREDGRRRAVRGEYLVR